MNRVTSSTRAVEAAILSAMRVLVVEDDQRTAETAQAYLRSAGFVVDRVDSGRRAIAECAVIPYDAVVLDLGLPDMDGVEVCREMRTRAVAPRILMATARDSVDARIYGLESGADDYIVKPYALSELVARLRALMRRPGEVIPAKLQVDTLVLDSATRRAARGARAIELTTKEFVVLEYLMRNPGRVLTREQISEHAWDANYDPFSNVVDVYLSRLRKKIDGPTDIPLVLSVRGAGYRFGERSES
ncbi:MAG: transcriptional regulator [Gemmatimonadetes bacterium]|nr:transcriptional regulator [Gemmatimonadota bacterium]